MELEKTFASLESKKELLVTSMAKNFGKTHQDLPNFRMPESITAKGSVGAVRLMNKQTDILGMDDLFGAAIDKRDLEVEKGAGILKMPLSQAAKSYLPKHTKTMSTIRKPMHLNKSDPNDNS